MHNKETADDIISGRLHDCPGDLKVLIHRKGMYYPISKIESINAIPLKDDDGKEKAYLKVNEEREGSIRVMIIE